MSRHALPTPTFYIVTVPTPIDGAHRPDLRRDPFGIRDGRQSAQARRHRRLRIDRLSRRDRRGMPSGPRKKFRPYRRDATSPSAIHRSGSTRGTRSTASKRSSKWFRRRIRATLDIVADVYGSVVKAGIHRAPSIKVAEAAKVIENTQRDLNIAFMNELSAIFHQLGIDTGDVLAAASTKWNFLNFQPGLVGGHCIGVDPYYLTFRAEKAGYHPEIILAGRRINDGMGERSRANACGRLLQRGRANPTVTILGMTFKENVPDIRNSKVIDVVRELQRVGVDVQVADPLASPDEAVMSMESA